MKILLTSATLQEIEPLINWAKVYQKQDNLFFFEIGQAQIHILISGIGMIATSYNITNIITQNDYDIALNFGLCGAYPNRGIQIGDVVNITQEELGDTGAMDHENFLTVFDLGLIEPNEKPFINKTLKNPYELETIEYYTEYDKVKSITVASTSGEEKQIALRQKLFSAQVENMEGAAFFYVMLMKKIKFFQIRAVSNIIEPRNKQKWQVKKAINRLNDSAIEIIKFLACSNLMI